MTDLRVVFPEVSQIEIEEAPPLAEPGLDQVRVKTICSLISPGTELAWLQALPNTPCKFPMYPGYSNVGLVEAAGPNVENFKPGDRVISMTPHAHRVMADQYWMAKVPDGVSSEDATFAALGAVSLNGVRRSKIELGEACAVYGLGIVGHLALQLARWQGGCPMIGVDLDEKRLSLAEGIGADYVLGKDVENTSEKIKEITDGGAPVVIEATGVAGPVVSAIRSAGRLGRVILLASTRADVSGLNYYSDIHSPGIEVIGAHNGARPEKDRRPGCWTLIQDISTFLHLIAGGRIKVSQLIDKRFEGKDAPEAFQCLLDRNQGNLGVILNWDK